MVSAAAAAEEVLRCFTEVKKSNTAVQKYSITSLSPAFKTWLKQKYKKSISIKIYLKYQK